MGAKREAAAWAGIVAGYAAARELRYEPVGGINPKDGPVALCVGGTNRLTGELVEGFWGASCDAEEREEGGLFGKAVLPRALLAKAHMPDLARVVPAFNVESVEPHEVIVQRFARRVEFESIEFNRRYLTTVPSEYDPIALRELFGPGFLAWATRMSGRLDFGINDRQLWFTRRLAARTDEDLRAFLRDAGELFRRVRSEMEESGIHAYPAGPWHAGLEPFPAGSGAQSG